MCVSLDKFYRTDAKGFSIGLTGCFSPIFGIKCCFRENAKYKFPYEAKVEGRDGTGRFSSNPIESLIAIIIFSD